MGVEEIIARINADAAAEAERILRAADDEVSRIRREGDAAAQAAYIAISADGRREAMARRRKLLARAELAARGGVREVREEAISRCFSGAKKHLSHLPHTPAYPDVLRRLIAEGQEAVGPGEHHVLFREEDQDAAERALAAFPEVTAALLREEAIDRSGGGIVVTCRNHRCDQRFSARFERMREHLTRETARILFDGHD
ncbi:V-type ATP synthase subunit E [Methanogenium sp. S4BF]|uniref:V-type ATP synthase subunit E n=1 Tax=Methanogenium sp. S4BF TaxID=1789226 RepID=UPI002417F968|nr:V-type ATP synthase subunit E [Methanogenium sp. S4BF]WFN35554.1 V-type ATP synthase subunit E [Methanogenium sp. S4BF]